MIVQTGTMSATIATETILLVDEYHFTHLETKNYKIFRIKFPCQTKKITFKSILGFYMEIPFFMQQQNYAIIINDCGNLKMKIPRSAFFFYWKELSHLKENTINISIKESNIKTA